MCQSRVKDAANGPGISLIEEKYRRHTSRLRSPTTTEKITNSQSIVLLSGACVGGRLG